MSATPLLLVGATGRMGTEIRKLLAAPDDAARFTLAACVASGGADDACPPGCRWIAAGAFDATALEALPADAVAIDVSLAAGTESLVTALERTPRAAVFATTGLSDRLEARIEALGRKAAVVRARNLSLGVAVARRWLALLPPAARAAYVADIVEHHHAGKKDAPSGTAIDLATALGALGAGRRPGGAVATHSIRAGTVPGTHRVLLSGDGETLEVVHTVTDRSVFARGALRAARFAHGRAPGLYTVDDLIHDTRLS
ncbi:MAG TPA: dihydrodipicolinate reductase C-terminal domain-containing protein [Candidatus Eisenbacteria bacterium]|nr:dihydrodipicolinate reductase C-terminal domain-containing protein [Candidatus Eisenbacteria bacterium]